MKKKKNNNNIIVFGLNSFTMHIIVRFALFQGENDWTALLLTARSGHYDLVQLLVGEGADIDASNSKRETALYLAACE